MVEVGKADEGTTRAAEGKALPTQGQATYAVEMEVLISRLRSADSPEEITAVLETLIPTWSSVSDWVRVRKGRYTRSLVYRDEKMEVLILTWSKDSCSPIHDHAEQQCWMRAVHGSVSVTPFRLLGGENSGGRIDVEPDEAQVLDEGCLGTQDTTAIHRVQATKGTELAVTLHVYAKPIDCCRVYDPRRGSFSSRRLRYDYVGPRSRREGTPRGLPLDAPEPETFYGALKRLTRKAREASEDLLVPIKVPPEGTRVQVSELQHTYGGVKALQDINLNVRSGEFLCLLGPSGCGKSTLLHALAGHVHPTSGRVSIDGKEVTGPGPDRLLMLQDASLFPWLTVEQNISIVLAGKGTPRKERSGIAHEYLSSVQLDGFEKTLPHQLSGGMKMRASLARALAMDPPVLLMDEPFGSLDAQTRLRMHDLLFRIWSERQKTIVFVTHDVHEALMLGTRVVMLAPRPGRIIADFEVKLPFERDPDDPLLAELASRLRRTMQEVDTGERRIPT